MIQRLSLDVWLHQEGLSGWTTRGIPGWIDRGFSRLVCLKCSIPLRLFLELINLDVTSWLMTIIKDRHNMASNIPHDQKNRFIQIRHRAS